MTMRGFVMWYLGSVIFVGAVGASAYQALLRQHAAEGATAAVPEAVAEADMSPQALTGDTPEHPPEPAPAASLPKLRPHAVAAIKPKPSDRKRTVAAHAPVRRPTTIVAANRPAPADRPWPYAAPPPPPPSPRWPGYYAYPAQYPYANYYPYYPNYGYYRSF